VNNATAGHTSNCPWQSNANMPRKIHLSSQESFQTQDFQMQDEDSEEAREDDKAHAFFVIMGTDSPKKLLHC